MMERITGTSGNFVSAPKRMTRDLIPNRIDNYGILSSAI